MSSLQEPITIRVPCSTSNLGPGFDCLGCALQLYNEFRIRVSDGENRIIFTGPEGSGLRPSPNNLLFHSAHHLFQAAKVEPAGLHVEACVNVPNARGLGSSATAIAAGLIAANQICGEPFDKIDLVRMATEIEGHPDNVTPAILGGLTAALLSAEGRVIVSRWKPHESVAFVLLSPDYEIATKSARSALPSHVPHGDAVANLCRVPLLIDALVQGRFDDLNELMQDRLHEPYREKLYPRFAELKRAVIDAGAAGVCLSGAGPTMLAVVRRDEALPIMRAWQKRLESFRMSGQTRVLEIDTEGAQLGVVSF